MARSNLSSKAFSRSTALKTVIVVRSPVPMGAFESIRVLEGEIGERNGLIKAFVPYRVIK